jgi:hypothetical protein
LLGARQLHAWIRTLGEAVGSPWPTPRTTNSASARDRVVTTTAEATRSCRHHADCRRSGPAQPGHRPRLEWTGTRSYTSRLDERPCGSPFVAARLAWTPTLIERPDLPR